MKHYQQFLPFGLAFVWLLVSKENMALWGIFVASGLFMAHYGQPRQRWWALGATFFALIYFVAVMKWWMPMLANRPYNHFHYHILGSTVGEIFQNLIQNPLKYFLLLFQNHHADPYHRLEKEAFWLCLLWLGGYFLLLRPYLLWMLIPILFQKLYNDDPGKWGFNNHYSIELAPLMTIGVYLSLADLNRLSSRLHVTKTYLYYGSWVLAVVMAIISIGLSVDRLSERPNIAFWKAIHYQRPEFSVNDLRELMDSVPPDVPLTATDYTIPHLAFRQKIYYFPIIQDAEYALVCNHPHNYYYSSYENAMDSLNYLKSKWTIIAQKDTFMYLLKRPTPIVNNNMR